MKTRVFLSFLLFAFVMLGLLWLLETVFLGDFYRLQVTSAMRSSSSSIAKNIDNENLSALAERLAERNNLCILVVDSVMREVVSAEGQQGCVIHHMGFYDLQRLCRRAQEIGQLTTQEYPLDAFRNNRYDAGKFVGRVPPSDDGTVRCLITVEKASMADGREIYILLNALVTPVTGTVQTIRWLLLFITILLIAAAFLFSLLISQKLSRPLSDTTLAARRLSEAEYTPVKNAGFREIRELNDCLSKAAEDLQQVNRMQKELVANISHDLRTPLTLMQGYAEVIRDIPGENTPENVQIIIDETKRLTTLVNGVMELNSLQGAENPQTIALDEKVDEIIVRYGKMLEHQGYVILREGGDGCRITADPTRLEQVICNLLGNALTYTGEDKTVRIQVEDAGETLRIGVKDSGEGIPEEDLPYIWDRYFRGSKPHKRPTVGSGLGLNIVKNILEKNGLPYGVNSKEGEGSCFWFEVEKAL